MSTDPTASVRRVPEMAATVRMTAAVETRLAGYLPAGRTSRELDVVVGDPAMAELEWRRLLIANAYEAYLVACESDDLAPSETEALSHVMSHTGEDIELIFDVLDICHI
jgi:hypothetical protein